MTVQSTTRKAGPFDGNGVTTAFPFEFKVFQETDIRVVLTDANGVETDGVINSNYSVTLNADQDADPGGTVNYPDIVGSVLPVGSRLTIVGAMPQNQLTDITNVGRFNPDVVERAFDKSTILVQQLHEQIGRAVLVPVSSDTDPADLIAELVGSTAEAVAAAAAATAQAAAALASAMDADADADAAAASEAAAALSAANAAAAGTAAALAQVNAFKADLALQTAAPGTGAFLAGYKLNTPNTVGRTVQDRLQSYMDAGDFGLSPSNTGAQNVAAWAVMKAVLIALGGGHVHFRRGTYDFNTTIDFSVSNVCISGEGIDATVLRTTHASADLIQINQESVYQEFRDLTLSSSVTRTGGSMFHAVAFWRRGLMHRVKVMNHIHGIELSAFEVCTLSEVVIASPTGAGVSLICGAPSVPQTGANLTLLNCFLRGHDDLNGAAAPVSAVGIVINDCQAVFGINCDIGGYRDQCMVVQPTTAAYNHHFVQCYFDGTKLSDNVLLTGAGTKDRFQFTGCWFNGAGQLTGGSADCFGVNFTNNGTYSDFNFSGCRFVSQKASAISVGTPHADINLNGCVFNNVADTSATYRYSIYIAPAAVQVRPMNITGCKFRSSGNALSDLHFGTNARGNALTGNMIEKGVTYASGATWAKCSGNADASSDTIAAADPFFVSPTKDYYNVTGSTTIGTMPQTYPGHLITLVAINGLTWNDSAGIKLAGNYVAPAQGTLHLRCEGTGGGWREVSRVNA